MSETPSFIVRGDIRQANGNPLDGVLVRAFGRDLRRENFLGETITNDQGAYEITYSPNHSERANRKRADLVVRAFDSIGQELSASEILFNAPPVAQIDLVVNPEDRPKLSDYERTMASVASAVDIPLTRVNEDDFSFIAKKTGVGTSEIKLAIDAAKAADRSGLLSPAVFYGLGRAGLQVESDDWLNQDTASLIETLDNAINENTIPARLRENLNELAERVDQLRFEYGRKESRVLKGVVKAEVTDEPLEKITVRAQQGGETFDEDVTDARGNFSIEYITDLGRQTSREFVLDLISDGAVIVSLTVSDEPGQPIEFQEVKIPPPTRPEEETLAALANRLSLNVPQNVIARLEAENIRTLTDLRRAGGLGAIANLPTDNDEVIRLGRLANLSIVSENIDQNLRLAEAGFNDPGTIARNNRSRFVTNARAILGDFRAAELYEESRVGSLFSDYLVTGFRLDMNDTMADPFPDNDVAHAVEDLFPASCRCHQCEGATSPVTYLADLLHYALSRVVDGGTGEELTFQQLTGLLHQPFGTFPASCGLVETEVRQVRICIEVLRSHLTAEGLPDAASPAAAAMESQIIRYREETYIRILNRLGASLEQLREAKRGDAGAKSQVSIRLGINPAQPELLEELLLPPNEVTEAELERLFGFRDTNRSPVQPTPQAQFAEWLKESLRSRWREDDTRRGKPIIDPDVVGPGDLRDPRPGNVALDLRAARHTELTDRFDTLKNARSTAVSDQAWLDSILLDEIGRTSTEMVELDDRRGSGENIAGDLQAMGLQIDELLYLARIINAVKAGESILDAEADDVCHILVQAFKRRQAPTWIGEENAQDLILGPDLFLISEPTLELGPPVSPFISRWRASDFEMAEWRSILQARIDQEASTLERLRKAVEVTEEETLLILREALVKAGGLTVENLTKRLLIECQADTCLKTTRIAQAIQTMQSLFWALRTRQVNDTPALEILELEDDQFDEVWKWLGSYETWRSAMTVFLYPENVLLPSLRPIKTPAFERLIAATRSKRGITPEDACTLAKEYEQLIEDIPRLKAAATCTATTRVVKEKKCGGVHIEDRKLFFIFAYAEQSRTIYWSTYDPTDQTGFAQSFWDRVPNVNNVSSIVGVSVYREGGERYIYLFYIEEGEDERKDLKFIRYDLTRKDTRWDSEPTSLKLKREASDFEAVIRQGRNDRELPEVALRMIVEENKREIWLGRLSRLGSSGIQELGDWRIVAGGYYQRLLGLVGWKNDSSLVITQLDPVRDALPPAHIEVVVVRRSSDKRNSAQLSQSERGEFLGVVLWPNGDDLAFVLWKKGDKIHYQAIWGDDCLGSFQFAKEIGPIGIDSAALEAIAPHFHEELDAGTSQARACELNGGFGGLLRGLFSRRSELQLENTRAYRRYREGSFRIATPEAVFADDGRLFSVFTGPGPSVSGGGVLDPDSPTDVDPDEPVPPDPDTDPNPLCVPPPQPDKPILELERQVPLVPLISRPVDITNELTDDELRLRKRTMEINFSANTAGPTRFLVYLEEAYYFVPVHLALQLQRSGHFLAALDWYRTVYDYTQPVPKLYHGLIAEESIDSVLERPDKWLLDPLTPHAIAAVRRNALTKFTVISIVQCLLSYADWEFSRDTVEAIERARTLYRIALDLLGEPRQSQEDCDRLIVDVIGGLRAEIPSSLPEWPPLLHRAAERLRSIEDPSIVRSTLNLVREIWSGNQSVPERVLRIYELADTAASTAPTISTLAEVTIQRRERATRAHAVIQRDAAIAKAQRRINGFIRKDFARAVSRVAEVAENLLHENPSLELGFLRESAVLSGNGSETAVSELPPISFLAALRFHSVAPFPAGTYHFCIPPNPVPDSLRGKARLNLQKILSCRNISGEEREILPYTIPLDEESNLQALGDARGLTRPRPRVISATPYRYNILIERAKQFAQLAQQMESAFLAALEKYDAESYSLMKARFDVRLSREGIRLHELALAEAEARRRLVARQHTHAGVREQYYQDLRRRGNSSLEIISMGLDWISSGSGGVGGVLGGVGGVLNQFASFEKRDDDWRFQATLAAQQREESLLEGIAAGNRVGVANRELNIAVIQADQADTTAEFLVNKFTNADLYEWMSANLEQVYRFFLQQATSLALVAEDQLAFERQSPSPSIIQRDYWAPVNPEFEPNESRIPDRRGLTGSARLLEDIFKLDQHAFTTDRRKQQLTKTISLAQLFPIEMGLFQQTGVLRFPTAMELFDRDFPGHYLRLLRSVRISVVALIPPTAGVKATLACSGRSNSVVEHGGVFRTIEVRRPPETISFSAARDASGMFDLQPQNQEMLFPFEGLGVDTDWEFQMPKAANQFDYRTISDILVTIEYTALESFKYRQQVIRHLGTQFSADRVFSFRHELADQFYDLNNPEQTQNPMAVRFRTTREDFPPNLDGLAIQHVTLFFSRAEGVPFEVPVTHLQFTENSGAVPVGGDAISIDGVVSTRAGTGRQNWRDMIGKSPVAPLVPRDFDQWELAFPDTDEMRNRFKNEDIKDILFVITYTGRTPAWPG